MQARTHGAHDEHGHHAHPLCLARAAARLARLDPSAAVRRRRGAVRPAARVVATQPCTRRDQRARRPAAEGHRPVAGQCARRAQQALLAGVSTLAPAWQGGDPSQHAAGALHALRSAPAAATGRMVGKMASTDSAGTAPALVPHVLALDDDPSVRQLVHDYLVENELRCTAVATGAEFDQVMAREAIDMVVLDVRLQGEDGLQIARRLRETSTIPILMLTGRAEEADRVMGLELGADDYLTKPFSPRELLARIRALLRRARAQATVADAISKVRAYRFGGWELNIGLRRLKSSQGKVVELTNGEFSLLAAFVSSPQRVLSRDQLLDLSRLHNAEVYDRSIDVQILRLRRKIEVDPAEPQFIKTERGAGYFFAANVELVT